eukprot:CAMPEP_0175058030 /NCGR_PEP_ID=MMETSP0052_2-20121109/11608_1 /TAXON_ID=51329 ORGANISM="Polytomella parva, Strain SAG 63-3" /NCGR_SAMPLE_ID=MMETSP0052_2 /ASSEMBLY_ACC=CAM_ASM_000194 /LENGTH=187 /DNA_ID=CAMNT_0016323339 /DNA_START=614 /DNA_END=1174 /DNA_ORIENTATION=-
MDGGSNNPGGGPVSTGRSLVAVAEDSQITLWDVRQAERGGMVAAVQAAPQGFPIWAMALCRDVIDYDEDTDAFKYGDFLLGFAGAERALTTLEMRSMKWHFHRKWSGCVKYPVTHLCLSKANPRFAYVAGLDYECVAGRWDGSTGQTACSGNSNSGQTNGHGGRAVGRLDDERMGVVTKGSDPEVGL